MRSGYETVAFQGGPLDGLWRTIPAGMVTYAIADVPVPVVKFADFPDPQDVRTFTYRRTRDRRCRYVGDAALELTIFRYSDQ